MYVLLDCLLAALCTVIAATGLLTNKLRYWQYGILLFYVAVMAGLGWCIGNGHDLGIPMIIGMLILIIIMIKENRTENVCLACVGYLIGVLANNSILFLISLIPNVTISIISEKFELRFSIVFIMIEIFIIWILRIILYKKIEINRFMNGAPKIRYGLIWNLIFFIVIFASNIIYGKNAGYNTEALRANCVLFGMCLLSSSFLIVECAKSIQAEEVQKAEQKQKELMQNYIKGMEYVLDEQRAFRHDYKNMLAAMAGFIREKRMEELETFFTKQMQVPIREVDENSRIWILLRNVYPIEIKGFLYEKVLTALTRDVKVSVNVHEEIHITNEHMNDLLRILGILMDNAIEAVPANLMGNVNLMIRKTDKGILIRIENNFSILPDISRIFEKGYSTKGSGRGNGLYWVRKILQTHTDILYDFNIEEKMVIQQLEILQ